jgi:hypothetical protein
MAVELFEKIGGAEEAMEEEEDEEELENGGEGSRDLQEDNAKILRGRESQADTCKSCTLPTPIDSSLIGFHLALTLNYLLRPEILSYRRQSATTKITEGSS